MMEGSGLVKASTIPLNSSQPTSLSFLPQSTASRAFILHRYKIFPIPFFKFSESVGTPNIFNNVKARGYVELFTDFQNWDNLNENEALYFVDEAG